MDGSHWEFLSTRRVLFVFSRLGVVALFCTVLLEMALRLPGALEQILVALASTVPLALWLMVEVCWRRYHKCCFWSRRMQPLVLVLLVLTLLGLLGLAIAPGFNQYRALWCVPLSLLLAVWCNELHAYASGRAKPARPDSASSADPLTFF